MLGAGVFVFQLRHFLFRTVEHTAELVRKTKIDTGAGNSRATFELSGQSFTKLICLDADLFQQRLSDAVALIEQRGQKMLVGDFLMIELRSDILRRLQRFLHLLRKFIDAHPSNSERNWASKRA